MRVLTSTPLAAALRFSRAWRSRPSIGIENEVLIPGSNGSIPGTLFEAEGSSGVGWVVLHGMTRLGRGHPELIRFSRSLSAVGAHVLIPEIREWTELEFAPEQAQAIVRAAVDWFGRRPEIEAGGVMLVGFSFGAPQAILAASDAEWSQRIRGVVGWGGYADIERAFRFSFTGEHDWEGISYRQRPDPYARWVIGRNCIPLSPALSGHQALARALFHLAVEAGEKRLQSRHSSSDSVKEALRAKLPSSDRELFDVFAPATDHEPDPELVEAVVREFVPLIRREMPLVEPFGRIDRVQPPVRLLHGRSDHLIPFTETLRLGKALESKAEDITTRLTGLYDHSGDHTGDAWWLRAKESVRFLASLGGIFEVARGQSSADLDPGERRGALSL